MKRAMLFFICMLLSGAGARAHDFHYYKAQTLELLPILGIKEAEVAFAVTHKEVSIEQRHKKPKTIFLNIEKLSKLTPNAVLFECALQVQLTTLDWEKIMVTPLPLSEKYLIFSDLPSLYNGDGPIAIVIIYLALLIGKGCLMAYDYNFPPQTKPNVEKFTDAFVTKIIDTIYALLLKDQTAHLTFIGFEQYHTKILARKEELLTLYSTDGVLKKLRDWIKHHSEKWQEIKKELKSETIKLIEQTSAHEEKS